jgi:hypothetical protein
MGRDSDNIAGAGRAGDRLRAAIKKQNAQLLQDALRYQFLRAVQGTRKDNKFDILAGAQWRGVGDCDPEFFQSGEEIDAAIDAEMEKAR